MLPPARWLDALRWSVPALHAQAALARRRGERAVRRAREPVARGDCPLCGPAATFAGDGANPRESPLCVRCCCVPRTRALVLVLRRLGIDLARAAVHECSPSLPSWSFLRRASRALTASLWLPDVRAGARVGVFHNADLGRQPFPDGAFDVVVAQDVLEHVPDPGAALREIRRTLRPGGVHVFTVPRQPDRPTRTRVAWRGGVAQHLLPPEHHRDPSTRRGALVVTDWGMDLETIVADRARASCDRIEVVEPAHGIPRAVEVFVVRTRPPQ
jgi:SAM-dependent methyltransferase